MKVNKQKTSKRVKKGRDTQCGIRQSYQTRKNKLFEKKDQSKSAGFINSKTPAESEKIPMYCDDSNQDYTFASVSNKTQLAAVEDEDYLDYEPSEVEVPHHSPANPETGYKESNFVNNKQPLEFNSVAPHNKIQPQYPCLFSSSLDHTSVNRETKASRFCARNANLKNDEKFKRTDGILEEHPNENRKISTYNGGEPVNEERQLSSRKNVFDDAKVDFKGVNIEITRFMKKNTQTENGDSKLNRTVIKNEANIRCSHDSSNLKVISIDEYIPEGDKNMKKQFLLEKREQDNTSRYSRTNSRMFQNNNENCFSKFDSRTVVHDKFVRSTSKPDKNQLKFSENQKTNRTKNNHFYDLNNSIGTLFVDDLAECDNDASKDQSQKSSERSSGKMCSERSTESPSRRNEDEKQMTGKEEFITKWLLQTKEDSFAELLDSLCQPYFTTGCNVNRCIKKHSLESITKAIHQANSKEFEKLYKLTLGKEVWFKCLFDTFLECFKMTARTGEIFLLDMINDVYKVFNDTLIDKTSYINKIIKGLQELGWSFNDAIENIILKYGTSQLWLSDILLFLIAKEPDLKQHWCLIQKITRCRKEKIDSEVTTKLLMAAFESYPPDKELSEKVCVDIFEKNLADLEKIPRHFRNFVTKMLGDKGECEIDDQDSDAKDDDCSEIEFIEEQPERSKGVKRHYASESSSHSSSESLESKEGDHDFNGKIAEQETSRSSAEHFMGDNDIGKEKISSSIGYCSSKSVNERVVKRFVKTADYFQRSQIPANFIAHPSSQPNIDSNFQCNISLHNLLPDVFSYYPDVSVHDLRRLKSALKDADSSAYLHVLKSYSDPYSIENFIVNVLTLMKSKRSAEIYSTFMSLLENLEKNDASYMNDKFIKVSIEVLALNLVFMLNGKGFSKFSRNILMKLRDWHNLVSSKIFLHHYCSKSHMGRYLSIMNVLISAGDLPWVNEMFQVKALRLLGPAVTWPYDYKPSDIVARNRVVTSFLEKGFSQNIFVVNDLLRYIVFMYEGLVDGFDLSMWFNKKILSMLEQEEEHRSNLLFLTNDIINYYERLMDRYLLQAYMLHIEKFIENKQALKLFRLCSSKGVYQEYTVESHVLCIPTNFTNFEISCVLHCCFDIFKEKHKFPSGFHIEIVLPDEPKEELVIVEEKFRSNRSIYKVFETICLILESEYDILVEQPVQSRIFISQTMLYRSLSRLC